MAFLQNNSTGTGLNTEQLTYTSTEKVCLQTKTEQLSCEISPDLFGNFISVFLRALQVVNMATESSGDQRDTMWELSKENVKPVKSGRNVNCIAAVLQPSKQDMEQIIREKQIFEEEIIAGSNEDDPIEPWDRYLKWTIQYFPSGGNDHTLLNLLKKMVEQFKSEKYRNDLRYVNAWLKIAEIMKDPVETYSYMNTEGIGTKCAEFYIAWADEYEKYGDMKRADRIYNDGDEKCAQPRELLETKHMEFQLRVARGMLNGQNDKNNDDEEDFDLKSHQRTTLGNLKGKGRNQTVGTQRTGRALHAIQNKGLSWGGPSSHKFVPQSGGKLEIFEDEPSDNVSVMGQAGHWTSAPSSSAHKENISNPRQWKGVKIKQHHVHSSSMPPIHQPPVSNNFVVYEEDVQTSSHHTPHKIASNIESVLSAKKESNISATEFESIINDKPVHEANIKSGYDVDKVYTAMGEMQFEEVRAAHWRRRQRIQARKELEERQRILEEQRIERSRMMLEHEQRVEEERRLLDEEKMRIMELERKKLQLERKLIESKRMRMIAAKSSDAEDAEILLREEEDITIQLNSVKRDIRRANMAQDDEDSQNSAENFCAPNPAPPSGFMIYDETSKVEEKQSQVPSLQQYQPPHQQDYPISLKPTSSANSSLNHSKRSQPSPTMYTKEAMNQLDTWFQKPLEDDDCLSDSVVVPEGLKPYEDVVENENFGFKPISDEVQQQPARGLFSSANKDSFMIYTDENVKSENTRPAVPKSVGERKVFSQIFTDKPQCQEVLQVYSDMHASENNQYVAQSQPEDDKTGYCFDDVTVASSDFAGRAHLASTPFCSKSEKLQDMTHLNHLSRIQPELTVTDMLGRCNNPEEDVDDAISNSHPYSGPVRNPISIHADCTEHTNEMFYSTENDKNDEMPAGGKQLSPIMEASNESDKSSVMGITKSSRGDSESDKTRDTFKDPLKMKSFGSDFSKTNDFGTSLAGPSAKENDMLDFMDFGTIDCGLWGTPGIEQPPVNAFSNKPADDNVFMNPQPDVVPEHHEEVDRICVDFNSTSIKEENLSSISRPSNMNVIEDPWNGDLLNSIMNKHDNLSKISGIKIHYMDNMPMPSIRKGGSLNLAGRNVKLGQMVGEGAFAKVFKIISDESDCHEVLKVESPACPWEIYAVSQVKSRLRSRGMSDIAEGIVDINAAHFYKDGSLLTMPHHKMGTLLDIINANRNVMMKDGIARWIANQIMRIIHSLHIVGVIHGDIKPDNFVMVPLSSDYSDSLTDIGGIKLIDFGRSIDMTELPHGVSFIKNCCTSAFTCVQMQNKEPWNYHTDLYGIAGTMHVVLFGSYMKIRKNKEGKWELQNKIKRWFHMPFWTDFFSTLLNFPTPTNEKPITLSDSPLPRLISDLQKIETSDKTTVCNFFKM